MARVAINGLGRIGRAALKVIFDTPQLELVAVNDIADVDNMAYLLKYDSVYGRFGKTVEVADGSLVIDGQNVAYLSERNPAELPWGEMNVDLVFECTGIFTKEEDAGKHIEAGAEWVIISGPTKSAGVPTVVHGVNKPGGDSHIISCASCTTNCITPVMEVMERRLGIKKAIMTTVHAYTATQLLVDGPGGKDFLRGRAAAINIIPSSTGAAVATAKALPELEGKFDGLSLRVPTPVGSIADIVLVVNRDTSVEELNDIFREESKTERYDGILGVSDEPIVSSDIVQDARASIVDLTQTMVVDGDLVKIMSWYDNEWGYTNQMIREALQVISSKTPA
ncbi:MAG: type I glyceraldehyde-3-phosphate dehydrogenase [Anaerolineaceae bacterium]|nr:type I glyceraldehyde-3-phosphate dehydrogenase [Anaerolineaceae bacterium]